MEPISVDVTKKKRHQIFYSCQQIIEVIPLYELLLVQCICGDILELVIVGEFWRADPTIPLLNKEKYNYFGHMLVFLHRNDVFYQHFLFHE